MSPSSSRDTGSGERVFLHPSELQGLSTLRFVRLAGLETIRLGGSLSESPERDQWEGELNRYYHACGCEAGAVGLVIALLVWGGWAGFGGGPGAGAGVLLVVGGAIGGKIIGHLRANESLKKTIRRIQVQWGEQQ